MATANKPSFLRLERDFIVSPEVVFDTFTKPDQMRIWWGDNTQIEVDVRVGGTWQVIRREGDQEYLAQGTYLKVEPPHLLQYTFAMPQFSKNEDTLTARITKHQDGSKLIFEHAGKDIAAELHDLADGKISATEEGWQQGFDLMETAWSKLSQ